MEVILAGVRNRWLELSRQGVIDASLWSALSPAATAVDWCRRIVAAGFLGSVAPDDSGEVVKVGGREGGTDCEDRVLRLWFASRCLWPTAEYGLRWYGRPVWHVALVVDGEVVETMPEWALGDNN